MRSLILAAACLLIAADAPPAAEDTSKDDLAALQGVWKVVLMETNGKILAENKISGMTVTFKDDQMKLSLKELNRDAAVKLDTTKNPKQIAVTSKAPKPRKKGKAKAADHPTVTSIWIYRLSGDDLRICGDFTGGGDPPPADLTSKVKGKKNYSLVIFQRKKPAAEK